MNEKDFELLELVLDVGILAVAIWLMERIFSQCHRKLSRLVTVFYVISILLSTVVILGVFLLRGNCAGMMAISFLLVVAGMFAKFGLTKVSDEGGPRNFQLRIGTELALVWGFIASGSFGVFCVSDR